MAWFTVTSGQAVRLRFDSPSARERWFFPGLWFPVSKLVNSGAIWPQGYGVFAFLRKAKKQCDNERRSFEKFVAW